MKNTLSFLFILLPFLCFSQGAGIHLFSAAADTAPSYTPTVTDAQKAFNTSTKEEWHWDGSVWVEDKIFPTVAGVELDRLETIPVGDSTATVDQVNRHIAQPDYFTIATGHGLVVGDLINYNNNTVNLAHYDSVGTDSFPQAMIQRILPGASFDTVYAINRGKTEGVFTSADAGKWVVMGADGKPSIPTETGDSILVGYVAPDGSIDVLIQRQPVINNNTITQYVSTGEAVTMAASVSLDGGNANVKSFTLDLSATPNLTISALTNTMQWGQYNLFFHSATNAAVTFPAGWLKGDGTTLTTLAVPVGTVVSVVYDGTNYRTTAY